MTEIRIHGVGASPGVAIGQVFYYEPPAFDLPQRPPEAVEIEHQRFVNARSEAEQQLNALRQAMEEKVGAEQAQIFAAHVTLLNDPMLDEGVQQHIKNGKPVESAVQLAAEELAQMLRDTGDPLFAERATDVMDVSGRVLRILLDVGQSALTDLTEPCIVVAQDLTPSDTAGLNPALVQGIVMAAGGKTAHAAILARTLGIPAVVAVGTANMQQFEHAASVVLDGSSGEVIIAPDETTHAEYNTRHERHVERTQRMREVMHQQARTAFGTRVEILANAGELDSVVGAVENGAEGVGLLRTEFLYLNQKAPPSERQQVETYRAIFEAMDKRPITLRTLDVGGDKPPSYIDFPKEDNPFLGWRGIRVALDERDVFKSQVRAVLRAAVGHDVSVMFPMVDGVETFRAARALFDEARAELVEGAVEHAQVAVGTMIETPAAAVLADLLAEDSDFFSIGTNDLTQYTYAADRNNERVKAYFNDFSPGVLRLIQQTLDGAAKRDRSVGVCGELAGNPLAIPVLVGMGVRKLSMVSAVVPQAKYILSKFNDIDLEHIAMRALMMSTTAELEAYMQSVLETQGVL